MLFFYLIVVFYEKLSCLLWYIFYLPISIKRYICLIIIIMITNFQAIVTRTRRKPNIRYVLS